MGACCSRPDTLEAGPYGMQPPYTRLHGNGVGGWRPGPVPGYAPPAGMQQQPMVYPGGGYYPPPQYAAYPAGPAGFYPPQPYPPRTRPGLGAGGAGLLGAGAGLLGGVMLADALTPDVVQQTNVYEQGGDFGDGGGGGDWGMDAGGGGADFGGFD